MGRTRGDTGKAGRDGIKVLRPGRLPAGDERRIARIVRWEDESAKADFVIRCGIPVAPAQRGPASS